MPSRKSALKHLRSDEKKRLRNARVKSTLKTLIGKFNLSIKQGDMEGARSLLTAISSALDKAAKRGIIHKRSADRKKSRLAKKLAA